MSDIRFGILLFLASVITIGIAYLYREVNAVVVELRKIRAVLLDIRERQGQPRPGATASSPMSAAILPKKDDDEE